MWKPPSLNVEPYGPPGDERRTTGHPGPWFSMFPDRVGQGMGPSIIIKVKLY